LAQVIIIKFLIAVFLVFENPEVIGGAPGLSIVPEESNLKDKVFQHLFNKIISISFFIKNPLCGGQCQIVRRSSFEEVNRYNVNIVHGEDSDFFRRLRKTGKLHFFSDLVVFESPRRYRKFGYIILLLQGGYSLVYQQTFNKNVFKEWRRIEQY